MNKYVIGVIVLLGIILLSFSLLSSKNESKENDIPQVSSKVSVLEKTYDFGDIDIFGGKVSTTYPLKNEGKENVSIIFAVTSCACTEGEIGDLTFGMHGNSGDVVVIKAGEEKMLKAIFDPLAHGPDAVGKIKRELFLKTNSTTTPEIKVSFTANVVKK